MKLSIGCFLLLPAICWADDVPKTAGKVDFPTIPAIMIPPVPGVDGVQATLEKDLGDMLKPMSGISIRPARCNQSGELIDEYSITSIGNDGKFLRISDSGVFAINKDGSGSATVNGVVYESEGNGIGSIVTPKATFTNDGDGEGSYTGQYGVIELDGKGGGSWTGGDIGVIEINADGSGSWTGSEQGVIEIHTDGSGSWVGGSLGIVKNNGDGTGTINGQTVDMSPVPPVQPAGKFPPIQAFNPPKINCGYVITLSDNILFDFDKSELRETVKPYLKILSKAINNTQLSSIEVRGHTDAKGSDDYNQKLSERRAIAVKTALVNLQVSDRTAAIGFGERKPVAPNTLNGKDNPAGRQLNRRVEIFIRK
ncbi:MAG: hypothetical protein CR977_00955 [Gammaproteobacteria bacterium]|nr:MAG: hypothetical protein CR977_00955 [Gammaproteobacteria bacterium]